MIKDYVKTSLLGGVCCLLVSASLAFGAVSEKQDTYYFELGDSSLGSSSGKVAALEYGNVLAKHKLTRRTNSFILEQNTKAPVIVQQGEPLILTFSVDQKQHHRAPRADNRALSSDNCTFTIQRESVAGGSDIGGSLCPSVKPKVVAGQDGDFTVTFPSSSPILF